MYNKRKDQNHFQQSRKQRKDFKIAPKRTSK